MSLRIFHPFLKSIPKPTSYYLNPFIQKFWIDFGSLHLSSKNMHYRLKSFLFFCNQHQDVAKIAHHYCCFCNLSNHVRLFGIWCKKVIILFNCTNIIAVLVMNCKDMKYHDFCNYLDRNSLLKHFSSLSYASYYFDFLNYYTEYLRSLFLFG